MERLARNHLITIACGALQVPVLAAGKGWLAVDKPAGLAVHNAPGRDLCSCVAAFIPKEAALYRQVDMDPDFGVNPVHRLDRETSGLLLLAVRREKFSFFSNQFESRQAQKRYVAVLHGRLESLKGDAEWGTWQWPLGKSAAGRSNPKGASPRQPIETRYRVTGHSAHYTMVEIELQTGRTHQIRRHAKLAGHPVVGDARYGSTRAITYLKEKCSFDRLALHAHSLTMRLSSGKKAETIETPDIPAQIRDLFANDTAV